MSADPAGGNGPHTLSEWVDAITNHGWFAAIVATTWGVLLRWLISQYQKREKAAKEWTEKVDSTLNQILVRMKNIEQRSYNRRREDQANKRLEESDDDWQGRRYDQDPDEDRE